MQASQAHKRPPTHQVWEELLLLQRLLVTHRRCCLKHNLQQRGK
jgi:hypothetical protein